MDDETLNNEQEKAEKPVEAPVYRKRGWVHLNEDLLKTFFMHPVPYITPEEYEEVKKVIGIVLNTHFSKWYAYYEDLYSWVITALLNKHDIYNPEYRAYTFIYTIARNEAGNKIAKYLRETLVDEYPDTNAVKVHDIKSDGVKPLLPYLSGEQGFTIIEVPRDLVLPLLQFAMQGKNPRKEHIADDLNRLLVSVNYE